MEAVTDLANQMGVSFVDLNSLLISVCESIKSDKAAVFYTETATEDERVEIAHAYIAHAVKKLEHFYLSYLTNAEKSESFNLYVFHQLKESINVTK